jgi:trehalose/maltose hydrolase-like predicted phosphorylase
MFYRSTPNWRPKWRPFDLRIRYRGHSIDLHLTRDALTVRGEDLDVAPISLSVAGKIYKFVSGSTRVFQLDASVP